MQNYIFSRAFGSIHHINGCRYSLLKYLAVYNLNPPDIAVVVYTDQPAFFEAFVPFFRGFTINELPAGQTSNSKVDFLKQLATTYQGNLLYLDNDTFITQPLGDVFRKIEQGSFCLRTAEEPPGNQTLKDYLLKNKVMIDEEKVTNSKTQKHYNTDVIGFSHAASGLFSQVSVLQQQLQRLSPEVAENFAFSYFLQHRQVFTLQHQIAGYRNFPEFRKVLEFFFSKNVEESIPNLVKRVHYLDAGVMQQEKNRYDQLPFYKKLFNVLTGKAWSVRQYQNKI
jgi:hypothetical protein